MKPLVTTICAAWFVATAAVLGAQTTAQADKLLESARHREVMDGDLKGAIEQYRKIAAQFAKQPEVAAKALLQMGLCQEKLGQAEARKSYERIVREYGGAQQYASAARVRLAALGGNSSGQQATRAVWTGPKADGHESSLSPDGRLVSYPDWDTGNLSLRDLITGAERPLTKAGSWKRGEEAYAEVSSISRDGKQVAYAWYDDATGRYELRVIGINGDSNPRRVFANEKVQYLEPRDWSPDGKWIATYMTDERRVQQIGLIGVQDGSLRLLKSETDNLGVGGLSSDGKYLVYSRTTPGIGPRSYIIAADASSDVPVLPGTSSVDSPVWTPDGSRIVFVSDLSGSPGLWSIGVRDGKPSGEPERLKADFGNTRLMGFTRDGALFYSVRQNQTDIYVAGLDSTTGKVTSEPKRINQRVGNSWGRVAWLPDNKSLSFWNRHPMNALVVQTLSTREEREIWGGKTGRSSSGYAGWFPDGSLMAWQANIQPTVFRRVDSRTGEVQATWTVSNFPAPAAQLGGNIAFSPDLMTMFFPQKDEKCEGATCRWTMRAVELQTGRIREVFHHTSIPRRSSISPDGRNIAFIADDSVMVAATAGSEPRELYRRPDDVPSASHCSFSGTTWTRDGNHVLAFCRLNAGGEVWSSPTNGGSPEKSPLRVRPSEPPAVSPDGTQVAFVAGSNASEVWVMTGLLPDAKAALR